MNHQCNEFGRKLIHLSSLFIPLGYRYIMPYIFTGSINSSPFNSLRKATVIILSFLAFLAVVIELIRFHNQSFSRFFQNVFGRFLRPEEQHDYTGATYLLVASVVCVALFTPEIAFVSLCFLAIGDTFAAFTGLIWGRRRIIGTSKSLEGTLACFISTFIFSLFFLHPLLSLSGAASASLAEISRLPVNDNLKIPILSGTVMSIINLFV
ncbi:MAG: phosphatidate cytidylyltransferase [Candidatus Cloacimonetes bacterium]|nr:phosphatidate cytidylyltransferase [Candidatus Cloacimonadota bacterium]